MKKRMDMNNRATISGEIVSDFAFSHEIFGENFYIAYLASNRISDAVDVIPIMVSDRLVDINTDWEGRKAKIEGQFRSYNRHEGDKNMVSLLVFVREFEEIEEISFCYGENHISLDGYVCKKPVYRKTPLGREIADLLIAVNRSYGKSDYIPCIAWGRNSRFVNGLNIGSHISIDGRIQSREYHKKISDDEFETKTAYEVSANKIIVVEETES